eukprot:SAG31_NODE_12425_length_943_cov_0.983412_2_plen_89_part_00
MYSAAVSTRYYPRVNVIPFYLNLLSPPSGGRAAPSVDKITTCRYLEVAKFSTTAPAPRGAPRGLQLYQTCLQLSMDYGNISTAVDGLR